jgi:predicted transcriptional regulator
VDDVKRVAQTVGLWLAEGDRQTRREITFTNNQPHLVTFFHDVITKCLHPPRTARIAVYLPNAGFPHLMPVRRARYRDYIDARANSPYYIYRVSGVEKNREWRAIVSQVCSTSFNYQFVLQGFFAGEGNVKQGSHNSRAVRIAQAHPLPLLERMLRHYGISFIYGGHREYTISGRDNLEKFLALQMTCLHRLKHEKFLRMMAGYRQRHYPKHTLNDHVYKELVIPRTTKDLATRFERTSSRLVRVLSTLCLSGNVQRYHVNSTYYWVRADSQLIVVSKQKMRILNLLKVPYRLFELATILRVNAKAVSHRMNELEKLGLVRREKANWHSIATASQVVEK